MPNPVCLRLPEFEQSLVAALEAHHGPHAPRIKHGFSTRCGGVSEAPFDTLNLGAGMGDDARAVERNYDIFNTAAELRPSQWLTFSQVHGTDVLIFEPSHHAATPGPYRFEKFDAALSAEKGIALGVRTADCMPILIGDPRIPLVGAVHAGWRGLARGMLASVIRKMRESFNAGADHLRVAIGPCIGPKAFEVGDEVLEAFSQGFPNSERYFSTAPTEGKWLCDLPGLAKAMLHELGVQGENIFSIDLCTHSRRDLFYSHRRDGARSGRHLNFIQMVE